VALVRTLGKNENERDDKGRRSRLAATT
jgi:hypothetical protein